MESRINYVSFYEKKNAKKHLRNIFKITLKFLTRPVLPHITVNCVFIFAYDNNCLYWIENKLFLLLLLFITKKV
jgi:hypothetical protein